MIMSRIDFYHLQRQSLEEVLPKLLEKAYKTVDGGGILLKIGTSERLEFLNTLLWTYNDESFLPHGSKKDGFAAQQPIWLTSDDGNANRAKYLFLTDGAIADISFLHEFERVFNIFDGNSEDSLQQARDFWKQCKASDFELYYWQQKSDGTWEHKA